MGQRTSTMAEATAKAQMIHPPGDKMSKAAGTLHWSRPRLGSFVMCIRLYEEAVQRQETFAQPGIPRMHRAYNAVRQTTSEGWAMRSLARILTSCGTTVPLRKGKASARG